VDATEQMKEIGELGLHIWKTQMIEPLTKVSKRAWTAHMEDSDDRATDQGN
jgi:hypothetical protein